MIGFFSGCLNLSAIGLRIVALDGFFRDPQNLK
jgi:hypothetical protein